MRLWIPVEAQRPSWRGYAATVLVLLAALIAACGRIAPSPAPAAPAPAHTIPTRALGETGITLVYVPAAEFEMGSTEEQALAEAVLCDQYLGSCDRETFGDELPVHTVRVAAFWIGRTEVTNAQYRLFVEAGGYDNYGYWTVDGWRWKETLEIRAPEFWDDPGHNSDAYPVVGVNWHEAQAYARWAGARLPTEAEWELAARGTDGRLYPWGSNWDNTRLNYCDKRCDADWNDLFRDDGYAATAPVGSFPTGASPCGALDMAGNVLEWVDAWHLAYPGGTWTAPRNVINYKVLRGGSWGTCPAYVRSADRAGLHAASRGETTGFRLALSE